MHIPDGFLSPYILIPSSVVTLWTLKCELRKMAKDIDEVSFPHLSMVCGFLFVITSLHFPILGGTSIHLLGIGLITILFHKSTSYICMATILAIQAIFLGHGGVTSFFVNALILGFVGCNISQWIIDKNLFSQFLNHFFIGAVPVFICSILMGLILGIQPFLSSFFSTQAYFPFSVSIVLPAMIIPGIFLAFVEGVITAMVAPSLLKIMDREKNDSI